MCCFKVGLLSVVMSKSCLESWVLDGVWSPGESESGWLDLRWFWGWSSPGTPMMSLVTDTDINSHSSNGWMRWNGHNSHTFHL